MKKGQEYIGIVEQVEFPNKGIIRIDGERVIVKNSIMGQKVRFVVNKYRKGKAEGRLLEVIEKSELEQAIPPCPHFGICGGCLYQTLPYEVQCKIKSEQVKRMLDGVISNSYNFEEIRKSPKEYEYRNKMEFSFGDERKDGPLALGLHKKGSFYDIVSISECKIVQEDYNKIIECVLKLCKKYKLTFYHRMSHIGYLRHLLIRRAEKTGEILINLVTTSQALQVSEQLQTEKIFDKEKSVLEDGKNTENNNIKITEGKLLKELSKNLLDIKIDGKIVGILHTVNDSLADIVQSDRTDILYGQEYFYEELLGLKFKISTFSFFQTNSLGAEVLYQTVREFIGETKDKLIFDLYSGTGTIAQLLAPVAKKVIGVEIVEEAVEAAKENAKLNNLTNCEFIAGDVLKVIDNITDKPELIVLDPPRDGIHPRALERILAYEVERIIYISCKPSSLVRDLEIIQQKGYQVEKVRCVDMFPETYHVETIVGLHRRDT